VYILKVMSYGRQRSPLTHDFRDNSVCDAFYDSAVFQSSILSVRNNVAAARIRESYFRDVVVDKRFRLIKPTVRYGVREGVTIEPTGRHIYFYSAGEVGHNRTCSSNTVSVEIAVIIVRITDVKMRNAFALARLEYRHLSFPPNQAKCEN